MNLPQIDERRQLGLVPTAEEFDISAVKLGMNALMPVEQETTVYDMMIAGLRFDGQFHTTIVLQHTRTGELVVMPFFLSLELLREYEMLGQNALAGVVMGTASGL